MGALLGRKKKLVELGTKENSAKQDCQNYFLKYILQYCLMFCKQEPENAKKKKKNMIEDIKTWVT
jgi:hypothetical protein